MFSGLSTKQGEPLTSLLSLDVTHRLKLPAHLESSVSQPALTVLQ